MPSLRETYSARGLSDLGGRAHDQLGTRARLPSPGRRMRPTRCTCSHSPRRPATTIPTSASGTSTPSFKTRAETSARRTPHRKRSRAEVRSLRPISQVRGMTRYSRATRSRYRRRKRSSDRRDGAREENPGGVSWPPDRQGDVGRGSRPRWRRPSSEQGAIRTNESQDPAGCRRRKSEKGFR